MSPENCLPCALAGWPSEKFLSCFFTKYPIPPNTHTHTHTHTHHAHTHTYTSGGQRGNGDFKGSRVVGQVEGKNLHLHLVMSESTSIRKVSSWKGTWNLGSSLGNKTTIIVWTINMSSQVQCVRKNPYSTICWAPNQHPLCLWGAVTA